MPGPRVGGGGPGGEDQMLFDTGRINKSEKGVPGKGKTRPELLLGTPRPVGPETYVEIKAPTNVGTRTSIPYTRVLGQYRQRAESAIERKQIPKRHEKRVKEYFSGLGQ